MAKIEVKEKAIEDYIFEATSIHFLYIVQENLYTIIDNVF